MTFLPIVERELRVAARRKATYWSRIGAAGIAVAILAAVLWFSRLSGGTFGFRAQLGPIIFGIFSWLSFAFVCVTGIFLTADSVSEEKREGTLGLLFLTDLRGYDVVLGKLFSHSLVATYGLLAALPVIGIAFLVGGVTGGEFWRLVLLLLNTLFFCLAAGVFVSTISRDAQRAMSGAALLCGLFIILFPAIDWALAGWNSARFQPILSLASPWYGMKEARSLGVSDFWTSLLVVHLIAWTFLALASVLAPRCWQEQAARPTSGAGSRGQRLRFGSPAKRAALRVKWLAENPVRWLAGRDLWMGRFLWFVLAVFLIVPGLLALSSHEPRTMLMLANSGTSYYLLLFKLLLATVASGFFVDAMRTGTMELLLVTPLTPEQIVRGRWWALRRTFGPPLLVLLLLMAGSAALNIDESIRSSLKNNTPFTTETLTQEIIQAGCSLLSTVSGVIAIAWFGMCMGLITRKATHAVIKTIVFVQVVPGIALVFVMFGLVFTMGLGISPMFGAWLMQTIFSVLSIAIDVAFIVLARRTLFNEFRELASITSVESGRAFQWPKFHRQESVEAEPVA